MARSVVSCRSVQPKVEVRLEPPSQAARKEGDEVVAELVSNEERSIGDIGHDRWHNRRCFHRGTEARSCWNVEVLIVPKTGGRGMYGVSIVVAYRVWCRMVTGMGSWDNVPGSLDGEKR